MTDSSALRDAHCAGWSPRRPAGVRLLLGVLLLSACVAQGPAPSDHGRPTTQLSDRRLYRVTVAPLVTPVPTNEVHSWTLHVATRDGRPVDAATIAVDGRMPEHGHGLPTRPRVARALGGGRYVIEGMKFSMPGRWAVWFDIRGPAGADTVTFDVLL
jgi:hypothetical protein